MSGTHVQLYRSTILCAILISGVIACSNPDANPTTVHGAWLGTGKFSASRGSMDMKAQLEVLPDGTYRFMVLEPGILALAGVERGEWSQSGDVLKLTPEVEEPGEERSILFRSAPRNFQPKSLRVIGKVRGLELSDGPMHLSFEPNSEATAKLRESGEL